MLVMSSTFVHCYQDCDKHIHNVLGSQKHLLEMSLLRIVSQKIHFHTLFIYRQALFIVSVLKAKPVFVVSVMTAKPLFVVRVGLRVFQKNQKLTKFFVNLKNKII